MFIALYIKRCALQRSAMCFEAFSLHSAPDGAEHIREVEAINMLLLRSKSFRLNEDNCSCKATLTRGFSPNKCIQIVFHIDFRILAAMKADVIVGS